MARARTGMAPTPMSTASTSTRKAWARPACRASAWRFSGCKQPCGRSMPPRTCRLSWPRPPRSTPRGRGRRGERRRRWDHRARRGPPQLSATTPASSAAIGRRVPRAVDRRGAHRGWHLDRPGCHLRARRYGPKSAGPQPAPREQVRRGGVAAGPAAGVADDAHGCALRFLDTRRRRMPGRATP